MNMTNQELLSKLNEMQELKRIRDEASDAIDDLQLQIKEYMKDAEQDTLYVGPYKVSYKLYSKSGIDTKKLSADHPTIVEDYKTSSSYYRLTVV